MCQSQHPYSQLTDDSKFYLTSNDLISTFLLATTVTCFQILRVTEKSCRYVKFCLTNNALKIYQTRKTVSHSFPNTKNRVENKMHSGEFLTNFEVFENVVKGYPTIADVALSNSLIIHHIKTKKITSVTEVWIPGLSIDFDNFTSPFTL